MILIPFQFIFQLFGAVSRKLERRQSTSSSDESIESGMVPNVNVREIIEEVETWLNLFLFSYLPTHRVLQESEFLSWRNEWNNFLKEETRVNLNFHLLEVAIKQNTRKSRWTQKYYFPSNRKSDATFFTVILTQNEPRWKSFSAQPCSPLGQNYYFLFLDFSFSCFFQQIFMFFSIYIVKKKNLIWSYD